MLKPISTSKAPAAVGPYSQGMQAGSFIYVSGQLPINPSNGELIKEDIKLATKQSLENAKAILEEAGASLNDVVKVTVFLADMRQFADMNSVYAEYFTDHKPARAAFEVANLPLYADVEIEMIAYK
ncbi:RidA family protein [Fusibacter tunisiensis]|jgi:2-iminobutanoate/2-iminopropanoate deaminase|uniref:2-iminobutanoate/2-iminopropanoate deaminase n=1 Tax=Fusibacter tunisiensis TaxID=1008308 RepID=A0ABS2MMW5_9FIRM|nr:RidA family protein [Fusibacter tunisiensis]MBM7560742.1 2-iminobutanoate/2-iminopropanoate deaminase [Fusibacter tunisiensis]